MHEKSRTSIIVDRVNRAMSVSTGRERQCIEDIYPMFSYIDHETTITILVSFNCTVDQPANIFCGMQYVEISLQQFTPRFSWSLLLRLPFFFTQ